MGDELIVEPRELVLLVNLLHEEERHLTATFPFYDDLKLVEFRTRDANVRSFAGHDALETARNRHIPAQDGLGRDFPRWSDLRDAAVASGVVPLANKGESREWVRNLWGKARNPQVPRVPYLAFDTSALYDRVVTRALPQDLLPERGELGDVRTVLSNGVLQELEYHTRKKYGPDPLHALQKHQGDDELPWTLKNRATKKARKALAARAEAERLQRDHNTFIAPCEELEGGEENDLRIAASYRAFQNEHEVEVRMLTADSNMANHAHHNKLYAHHLQRPRELPRSHHAPEERIAHLLADLAVRFLPLDVPEAGARLWSDWNGKGPADWAHDHVRITHTGSHLMERFTQDLETAREVRQAIEDAR